MRPYELMENLIDKYGVTDTLLMISDICDEKAGHIEVNWQDYDLSDKWLSAGRIIRGAVGKLPKVVGIK